MNCADSAVCLFTSGLYAGLGSTMTIAVVQALKDTSDPLPAWKRLYKNASKAAVGLILVTSGLAVKCFMRTEDNRYLYVFGAIFTCIPYTVFLMKGTNDELFSIKDSAAREDKGEESRVRRLINKWEKLQYGRTALGVVGFAINIWIVCKKMNS